MFSNKETCDLTMRNEQEQIPEGKYKQNIQYNVL